ncbi:MAG: GAF domain-containing protein [Desulfuromonadaceae bacterium]|nr:GAF domain-containing protein [Desulfuromonadaceae bacterium]MDD2855901.1 GAF domain-containing protein [Desulfuromonadaceae bacterium]
MDTDRRSSITPDDFHTIIATSIDGILLVGLNGDILETNDSYCQMVGYSRDELLKLQVTLIDAIDNRDDVARRFELIIKNGSLRFETKHLHKDGSIIDVEVSANYSASYGGSIFSFIRDISSQKHTREIMAARLRLIEFSLTHSLGELLRQTLDEAEALTGSCIGFYHFKDPDSQTLTLQAWSTKTATIFCKAEGTGSHYPVSQAGVWVDCIHERRPVIHNDYASLPHKKGLPDGHAAVIRELVVPIFRHDKIVAIMGIGNKTTGYTQQDVEVISDITLVLTDNGMPIMDGYALFRELKLLKHDLPIIISSGFGDTVVTTRIPAEEIAGLASKPYRLDQLRDVLKKVVEGTSYAQNS